MPAQFLSCDWGTSCFRLRLVSTATNAVIDSVCASSGVKDLHEQVRLRGITRFDLFARTISQHIESLSKNSLLSGAPLVISGMASSTIGWVEIPYAAIPFSLDGGDLRVEPVTWEGPEGLGRTYIISGAASESDLMRGEETQVIGLFADRALERFRQRSVVVLPGTHSKHLFIENGKVTALQTYMTGELFQTLSSHSILSATATTEFSGAYRSDFKDGVRYVRQKGLPAALFRVRTRGVLDRRNPRENGAFLSGILIGAELADLDHYPSLPVIVAANEKLKDLYQWAMPKERQCLFTDLIDNATIAAHHLIISRFQNEL